jgi:hypothetical protein
MRGIDGRLFATPVLVTCALALGGCGDLAPGNIQLGLVGADSVATESVSAASAHHASKKLTSAFVTINEIDARVHGGSWQPLLTDPISVDLLSLDHQRMTGLGIGQLPSGRIDRLRLVLATNDAFVIDAAGHKSHLEVPNILKVVGRLDLDSCAAGTVILDFDPKIRTDADDECQSGHDDRGVTRYRLRSTATVRTEEVHGACGGGGGPGPTPSPGQCGNGNTVCAPDQICKNGDCLDACFGVACGPGTSCIKGQCVSNDPCNDHDADD